MCGICGIVLAHPPSAQDEQTVLSMMDLLAHRGPDGAGFWMGGHAALGHRRLSIIDIDGGAQPMLNEDGRTAVVFNGEIYNFARLRAQLQDRGHRFRTRCDTEVLVHGYEEWGDALPDQLHGMFSFVIHDETNRRTLVVRDRLGIKPLYYHHDPSSGRFIFASEVKALFADSQVPRRPNLSAVPEYLLFRGISGEETLFAGIREVEAGQLLTIQDGRIRTHRYWSPGRAISKRVETPPVQHGRDLLRKAVEARLVSDVPLGTITSGGLDSSLVSAIASELTPGRIDTFCVGFDDPELDERSYARAVAERIDSHHHELVVDASDIESELDRLTWAHDEPLTHPNSIPMHLIFREAKERVGVTVLLSGEGADEVFGGYDWYRTAIRREQLRRVPGLAFLTNLIPTGKAATVGGILEPDYLLRANAFTKPASLSAVMPDIAQAVERRRHLWPPQAPGLNGLFAFDQRTYLAALLQRQDRMSMAAGLEARVPFLDHQLVEWANTLPWSAKLRRSQPKGLLKDISRRWLPAGIIQRRKVGFALPLAEWLRPGGLLSSQVERLRDPASPLVDLLSSPVIHHVLGEHERGNSEYPDLIWSLVAMERWADLFLGDRVRACDLPGSRSGAMGPSVVPGP